MGVGLPNNLTIGSKWLLQILCWKNSCAKVFALELVGKCNSIYIKWNEEKEQPRIRHHTLLLHEIYLSWINVSHQSICIYLSVSISISISVYLYLYIMSYCTILYQRAKPTWSASIKCWPSPFTLKHWEMHGCIVSTVATDALVLKNQAIRILSTD